MNSLTVSKSEISNALKELLFKAFIPQALITSFYIICHWSIVTLWLTLNYNTHTTTKLFIIGLLGGATPFVSYGFWALRIFLIKSFQIVFNRIVSLWLEEFCNKISIDISQKITSKTTSQNDLNTFDFDELQIIQKLRTWIINKSQDAPIFIKKITGFVLKKISPDFEIKEKIKNIDFTNPKEVSKLLTVELSKALIKASNKLIPFQVIYLIPFNILLLIALWFY